jgi:hypothetical protein
VDEVVPCFLGHAAGGPAHLMEPVTALSYLMGGQVEPTTS